MQFENKRPVCFVLHADKLKFNAYFTMTHFFICDLLFTVVNNDTDPIQRYLFLCHFVNIY